MVNGDIVVCLAGMSMPMTMRRMEGANGLDIHQFVGLVDVKGLYTF
jgi:hypothetical protein